MPTICCISDIHCQGKKIKLPDADILAIAGDWTYDGSISQIASFNEWLRQIKSKYKHIVAVAGNHDFLMEKNNALGREMITNAIYLQDETIELLGLKIHGSPWQPEFYDWAFNLPRGIALRNFWDKIPSDTDVTITHSPAYGILDWVPRPPTKNDPKRHVNDPYHSYPTAMTTHKFLTHVGCEDLRDALERVKPKLAIWGHIHCAYGHVKTGDTDYVNAAICNESYDPVNPPIVVDVTPKEKHDTSE